MRCAILGFTLGATLLQTCASLPSAKVAAALTACAALLLAWRRFPVVQFFSGAGFGLCWAALLASLALAPQLARVDEGRDLTLVGTIDSLPYAFAQGVRFNFAVERVIGDAAQVPPRVALGWYAGVAGPPADIEPGARWRLTVRLQRPHGNANPGGFDYEAWLLEQGVRATGYVRPAAGDRRLDAFVPRFGSVVERSRALLRARILQTLAGKPYAGVMVALVIGDQRGIAQSDWDVFNRTGIGHLVSISGLHITMVAGLAALVASFLWRRSFFMAAQLPLLLPAQKVAALAGAAVAVLYVLLAGFGIPAQRTLYMILVLAVALWSGRIAAVSHVLCAALGVVVLLDPWAPLWPGFWLSFGAVAAILFAGTGRVRAAGAGWRATLRAAAHTQYVVTLALAPLTMLLFAQVSLASPLANAIAIPLVSFVVTPLALLGSLAPAPLSTGLLLSAHGVVQGMAVLLEGLSGLRWAVWRAPAAGPWTCALAIFGVLWMLAPRGWPLRWSGLVAWLPLMAQLPTHPATGTFTVTAFDVGQGMALLVETAGHRLLYDTGPVYSPDSNGGSRVILPYLRARGIAHLDGIVISHSDTDHVGGALALLQAVRVDWVASSLWPQHPVAQAARRHVHCVAGQRWHWDGIDFAMLHPQSDSYTDPGVKANAKSCVLRVSNRTRAMLLAGDIEAPQEALLLLGDARLAADVLLAPHHGSGTSSTAAFLQAVHPQVAVFQVGWRNRYRHPKPIVYERYGALGIDRMRTDEAGAVRIEFGAAVEAASWRAEHARYWHALGY
ncbi:DNA internalization-related competence protein ComEC/Rec2 [Massilia sp. S19_KUP03_FR1]|uniref:DNA internalization-related competence protein ComEC/Rec2 n=1 Tax=Massilia sp. S19_KUP03_FR1 TaxID=3025503 RepID=UPI002FCDAC58